jgi:hypothetical protein
MTERIYDALRAILFLEFPKSSRGVPFIYDREIDNWYIGERGVIPDNLTILISGQSVSESDSMYGYRMVDYSFEVKLYASGDDQTLTLRIATEGARIIRNILNNHKRIWVMDLCPICGKLPTSPEHFFVDDEHQGIFGIYGTEFGPTGTAGGIYNDIRSNWYKTHPTLSTPGNVIKINLLTSGSGYSVAPSITITGGGFGATNAEAVADITNDWVSSVTVTNPGTLYTAIPVVTFDTGNPTATGRAIISTPTVAGIGAAAFYKILTNFKNGVTPSSLSPLQISRFNNIIRDGVFPVREIFDVQIASLTPTNEAVDGALASVSTISLKFKELMPIEKFGPNFSGPNYNPQEAL